jgi:hypothetical protein
MTVPALIDVSPASGPASGGDLVRLTGTGFAARLAVRFADLTAVVLTVRDEAGVSVADVRTPPHAEGVADVTLYNLDADGVPIPGEEAALAGAYRFLRPRLATEADLTRLVRCLLRELGRQVLANVSVTESVDYDDTTVDGLSVVALSRLPSLVLSGPRAQENRFFSTNEPHEDVVPGIGGPELLRRRPPFTVDLAFTLTAASDRTIELLSLMAAVATFFNRNRWIELPRDPADPAQGSVRWEMDPQGDLQTRLDGPDDVRAFSQGFVIRGFDLDEGLPLDRGRAVSGAGPEAEIGLLGGTP